MRTGISFYLVEYKFEYAKHAQMFFQIAKRREAGRLLLPAPHTIWLSRASVKRLVDDIDFVSPEAEILAVPEVG